MKKKLLNFKSIERLRKEVRTKFFWATIALATVTTIGNVYGHYNPTFVYLQIPFAVLIMGTLPVVASAVLSVRFGLFFVWMHKNILNLRNKDKITYVVDERYSENELYTNFVGYNVWYSVGITFLLIKYSGISTNNTLQLLSFTAAAVFLGIILASGINFAVFLIKKRSIFVENKKDGSRINLGNDIRRLINFSLAPLQGIFLIYALVIENNIIPFLITLGFTLLICFVSSLASYFILKKRHIDKLSTRFVEKLKL